MRAFVLARATTRQPRLATHAIDSATENTDETLDTPLVSVHRGEQGHAIEQLHQIPRSTRRGFLVRLTRVSDQHKTVFTLPSHTKPCTTIKPEAKSEIYNNFSRASSLV